MRSCGRKDGLSVEHKARPERASAARIIRIGQVGHDGCDRGLAAAETEHLVVPLRVRAFLATLSIGVFLIKDMRNGEGKKRLIGSTTSISSATCRGWELRPAAWPSGNGDFLTSRVNRGGFTRIVHFDRLAALAVQSRPDDQGTAGTQVEKSAQAESSAFSSIANFYWGTAKRAPLELLW